MAPSSMANCVIFRMCQVGWCGGASKNKSGTEKMLVNITEGMRYFLKHRF
jgi:hypothetical protein